MDKEYIIDLRGVYSREELHDRIEEGLPVFVVLTREPGDGISFIHDRMPLILPEECVGDWIRPDADPSALLERALTDMIFEKG